MSLSDAIDRDPLPPVVITRLQAKREMEHRSIWTQFKIQIALDPSLSEEWDLATALESDDPVVVAFAATMGFDEQALDQFFRDAGKR